MKSWKNLFKDPGDYLRNVSVDNVIFGYHQKELKVLLQQPLARGRWTLAGGYILRSESIEEAAARIAFERTGLKDLFLEQYRAFGNPQRASTNRFTAAQLSDLIGEPVPADCWMFDYFVSVGFYTLTEFSKVEIKKADREADCRWWPIVDLPPMMFDHRLMIEEALKALRLHIAHFPIGYELLPEKFTLPEIHALYETILGKSLDDRNFTRKLLSAGIIVKLKETRQIGPHRSPYLYRFDRKNYERGLKEGAVLFF